MDEREQLRKHIREFLDRPECSDEVRNNAVDVSWCVMEALDSWIEEQQPQEEEIKVGDKVKLKRKLVIDAGSATEQECELDDEMEDIPKGDIGTVRRIGNNTSDYHLLIVFDSVETDWWFHPDDVEKV